jgi:hypothetical protein
VDTSSSSSFRVLTIFGLIRSFISMPWLPIFNRAIYLIHLGIYNNFFLIDICNNSLFLS